MDQRTRELVRDRARNTCEYCRLHQSATPLISFHLEHIVPKQHGGSDHSTNLALACDRCNAYKGSNLTSIDPDTGAVSPLFHPREHSWDHHFEMREGYVYGKSPSGRATVRLLNMNAPRRVALRLSVDP